jgi:hypothetical protein
VRSLYSFALILLPFFTSVLALAQPGGSRRAGIEKNTRSSPHAEPGARTEEINSKSLWGAFQDRAGEEISGQAWKISPDTPEIVVNRSIFTTGRDSVLLKGRRNRVLCQNSDDAKRFRNRAVGRPLIAASTADSGTLKPS